MIDDASREGICYSSMDPNTATQHARWLHNLGANFVIFDCTNLTKISDPEANPIYQASLQALKGFRQNKTAGIKVAYQLSLTCWQQQCHRTVNTDPQRELYTWNKHIKKHVESIYESYCAYPDLFETVPTDGNKPLLIFYCNQGSNVYDPKSPNQQFWSPNQDLKNKGHYPRWPEFNETIDVFDGKTLRKRLVRELFSVRFSLYCTDDLDFSPAPEIWPFVCDTEKSVFNEAGYAALKVGDKSRSIDAFRRMVDAARGKPYLILRCFNEFSTTDEDYRGGRVYTMEVNNLVHHYDEQKGDPWFHWNRMREKLASVR
jgi:hypothetical protein